MDCVAPSTAPKSLIFSIGGERNNDSFREGSDPRQANGFHQANSEATTLRAVRNLSMFRS